MEQIVAPPRTFTWRWIATWAVPSTAQIALSMWVAPDTLIGSATTLFWIVVIAASLCVVTSLAVITRSFRSNEADLGVLGLFFFAVSVLPLVHGITTPGVMFDSNSSTMNSVLLAIPAGLLAIAPFVVHPNRQATWIRARWRAWVLSWTVALAVLALALLIDVNLLPAPVPRQPLTIAVAVLSFAGCALLSRRHLRMARILGQPSPLIVSAGCGFVGSSAFVWLSTTPFSAGFWTAHGLDIFGVLSATIGALVVYRRTGAVSDVLDPVLVADPLTALELGLDPIVHRFVADLESKDPITRDHVVRTAELAIRVGEELRLGPCDLRRVGMTALLHDVGKLSIPDEILTKPGRLDAAEFDIIRTHAALGEQLVLTSPVLAEIAAGVRGHHERVDGQGYPDALTADSIPFDARIVAACDAFDAMSNNRQYRTGMGHDKAIAILNEHAGSQWDPVVVAALVTVVRRDPPANEPVSALDAVGRQLGVADEQDRVGCDCLPVALLVDDRSDPVASALAHQSS